MSNFATARHRPGRRMATAGAAIGATTLVMFMGAAPASAQELIAADAPSTVVAAVGSTVAAPVTVRNTGAAVTIGAPARPGEGMTFTAPPNTTFPPQSTVPAQLSTDGTTFGGTALTLTNCVVSNAGGTLTCDFGTPSNGVSWAAGAYRRFSPQVTVDPDAPVEQVLTGSSTMSFHDHNNGTAYTTSVGTMRIQTAPVDGVPMIAFPVAAGLVVAGAGGALAIRRRRRSPATA